MARQTIQAPDTPIPPPAEAAGLPPYSVVMSVYGKDRADWFQEAMESIVSQTWPPAEIVLVEDGPLSPEVRASVDQWAARCPGLFRRVALPRNMGLAEALRNGVEAAKCEWIARMDSDDISSAVRCEEELRLALARGADIVSCNYDEFIGTVDHVIARRVFPTDHESLARLSRRRSPLCHAAVMMKKSLVMAAGNYRSQYVVEDYDLFVRMLMQGARCCTVEQFLYHVRAGEDYFQRRGGWKYVKSSIRFNAWMLKNKWTSPADFLVRSAGTAVVGLAPGAFRAWVYQRMLRN